MPTDKLSAGQLADVLAEVHEHLHIGNGGWHYGLAERAARLRDEAARREGAEDTAKRPFSAEERHAMLNGLVAPLPTPARPADERERRYLARIRTALPDQFLLDPPDGGHVSTLEGVERMAARIAELERERSEALAVLHKRYVSGDLPKLVATLMGEHLAEIDKLCRLRGECEFDADLARFMRIIDHEPHVSRGQMSEMLDFAQAHKARAEAAEAREKHEKHVANEWADMATNGLQWLRNIRDGLSTVDEALAEMDANLKRIRALPQKEPGNG